MTILGKGVIIVDNEKQEVRVADGDSQEIVVGVGRAATSEDHGLVTTSMDPQGNQVNKVATQETLRQALNLHHGNTPDAEAFESVLEQPPTDGWPIMDIGDWNESYYGLLCRDVLGEFNYIGYCNAGMSGSSYSSTDTAYGLQRIHFGPDRNMTTVKQWFVRHRTAYVLFEDGELWGWGHNTSGQLGCGDTVNKFHPIKLIENIREIVLPDFGTANNKTDTSMLLVDNDGKMLMAGHGHHGTPINSQTVHTSWVEITGEHAEVSTNYDDWKVWYGGSHVKVFYMQHKVTDELFVCGYNSHFQIPLHSGLNNAYGRGNTIKVPMGDRNTKITVTSSEYGQGTSGVYIDGKLLFGSRRGISLVAFDPVTWKEKVAFSADIYAGEYGSTFRREGGAWGYWNEYGSQWNAGSQFNAWLANEVDEGDYCLVWLHDAIVRSTHVINTLAAHLDLGDITHANGRVHWCGGGYKGAEKSEFSTYQSQARPRPTYSIDKLPQKPIKKIVSSLGYANGSGSDTWNGQTMFIYEDGDVWSCGWGPHNPFNNGGHRNRIIAGVLKVNTGIEGEEISNVVDVKGPCHSAGLYFFKESDGRWFIKGRDEYKTFYPSSTIVPYTELDLSWIPEGFEIFDILQPDQEFRPYYPKIFFHLKNAEGKQLLYFVGHNPYGISGDGVSGTKYDPVLMTNIHNQDDIAQINYTLMSYGGSGSYIDKMTLYIRYKNGEVWGLGNGSHSALNGLFGTTYGDSNPTLIRLF